VSKEKNILPVYDLWPFNNGTDITKEVYAAPFAPYLQAHPHFLTPHRHAFYHMVLFTKGTGLHIIDFEQFHIQKGQIYFMVPGQVHSWTFTTPPDGYVVNFSPTFFASFLSDVRYLEQFQFFTGMAQDGIIQLPKNILLQAQQILHTVVEELDTNGPGAADMIRVQLISLFILLARKVAGNTSNKTPYINKLLLTNFRKLVEQFYAEKKLPKEYAALLYVTPNHLNALCKDVLGKPAGEIIRDRIILQAKRLLVNADLQIATIADQLNFPDNSYFTKFFKKYTGTTPEEFRKKPLGTTLKQ